VWECERDYRGFELGVNAESQALRVIPAEAGIVRLKAHLVREVEVLFRYALSGL